MLLERKQLTCGTTWHAAGLVGQLRATHNLTRLAQYTTDLFATWRTRRARRPASGRGSVSVATNEERFEELKRGASMARVFGLEVNVISPADVQDLVPLARIDDLVGACTCPTTASPTRSTPRRPWPRVPAARGVRIVENVKVDRIVIEHGRAVGVQTEFGEIRADAVVNAAGMWSRHLGDEAGAVVPLHAAEHFYIVTEGIEGISADMPVLRDPDGCGYFKEDAGKLLVGWFEPVAKPWGMAGDPGVVLLRLAAGGPGAHRPAMEAATQRMPLLGSTGIRLFFNGPESFTPDDRYLLGESPDVQRSVHGLRLQLHRHPVVGRRRQGARRLDHRRPAPMDLWDVDVRRTMPFQRNSTLPARPHRRGARAAVRDALAVPATRDGARRAPLAAARSPGRPWCVLRRGRRMGAHQLVRARRRGARLRVLYGKQNWFPYAAAEHHAVRNAVGLFDQSSFGKFQLEGPDAEAVLNHVCANDVAVPVGRIVYTQWLNEHGGIEADLTVTRRPADRFLIVTAAATQVRDFAWLREHIPDGRAGDGHRRHVGATRCSA